MCKIMCEYKIMPTNLDIDDKLLTRAQKIGKNKTKKETVTQALIEYIERREQKKITELFGKIKYDPEYSYKKFRNRQ